MKDDWKGVGQGEGERWGSETGVRKEGRETDKSKKRGDRQRERRRGE